MAERDSPEDLYPFAQALVRTLLKEKGLRWSSHRVEDAEQDLFLAGWQVWKDEGDIGLAKNRGAQKGDATLRSHQTRTLGFLRI
ncbi:MAG: hypothetical protein AB7F89_19770 [Pirellulaceae bacterium]